jgi:hypothetical protein
MTNRYISDEEIISTVEKMKGTINVRKVRLKLMKAYDFSPDQHENQVLSIRIGWLLSKLEFKGVLRVISPYKRGGIRYRRN